jgi:hypothetical protein
MASITTASSEQSNDTEAHTRPDFQTDEEYCFVEWDEGVRYNLAEKRWTGLLGMIKTSQLSSVRDEEKLQPLLELAFWEAFETLHPSHPRKVLVMNAFVALSTWEGYLRVSLRVVKLWFWRWIQLWRGGNWKQINMNNLRLQREYVRALMDPRHEE